MTRGAWVILALAAALRVGYAFTHPPGPDLSSVQDNDSYVALGAAVAEKGGLLDPEGRPSALREPVYPLILGVAFKVFGVGYPVVVAVNTLMGLAALVLMRDLGDRLLGPPVGRVAFVIGAFYPAFVFHNAQPMRETAMVLASVGLVAAVLRAQDKGTAGGWAFAGLVGAGASLLNTVFLPFALVVVPAGLMFLHRRSVGRGLARAGVYLAVLAVLYSVWPVRNYARLGVFILGSTAAAGSSFYTYLVVPQEHGGLPEQRVIEEADPVIRAGAGLDPVARERYFWAEGFKKASREPLRTARLMAWRFFIDIWRVVPHDRSAHPFGRRLMVAASLLSDGWILPAAAAGIVLCGAASPGLFWAYGLVASVNAVYALVLTGIRYRLPAMPWAILLASYALLWAYNRATVGRVVR